MTDLIVVQYVGFKVKALVREYTFAVREAPADALQYTLSIENEAFVSHRAHSGQSIAGGQEQGLGVKIESGPMLDKEIESENTAGLKWSLVTDSRVTVGIDRAERRIL